MGSIRQGFLFTTFVPDSLLFLRHRSFLGEPSGMGSGCGFLFSCRIVVPYKSQIANGSKIQLSSLVCKLLPSHEPREL